MTKKFDTDAVMESIAAQTDDTNTPIESLRLFQLHYRKALAEIRQAGELVIFGCGAEGRALLHDIREYHIARVKAFCDNNAALHGQTIDAMEVIPPTELASGKYSDVLVAITPKNYSNEILKQLSRLGVPVANILVVDTEDRWWRE